MPAKLKSLLNLLLNLEFWLVALFMAASLIAYPMLPYAACVPALFMLLRLAATGRLSLHTPSDIPVLVLLAMLPVTLWVTAFPDITMIQVYRLLSGIGLFYSLLNWIKNLPRLRLVFNAFLLAGLGLALIAPLSVTWVDKLPFIPEDLYQRFTILVQDAIHPNVMGGTLAVLIPVAVGWLLFAWADISFLEKLLGFFSSALMLVILGLTQSRGAWMAVGAVLVVFPVLRWRWGWILPVAGVIGAILVINSIGITEILTAIVSGGSIKGVASRMEIWQRALFMIRDFPFTGIGMGSFMQVADKFYPISSIEPSSIFHAHNLFLQIGVDLGVPGLLAWLGVWIIGWINSYRAYSYGQKYHQPMLKAAGIALMGSLAALSLHGLTDAAVWGMVRPAPLIWSIWGTASAAMLIGQHQAQALIASSRTG